MLVQFILVAGDLDHLIVAPPNLAEGHSLLVISAVFIRSCYIANTWPGCQVCLSWWHCQHNDCSLPKGNMSSLMSSLSVYVNMHMIVCISFGKFNWITCLGLGAIIKNEDDEGKHVFQQIRNSEFKTYMYLLYWQFLPMYSPGHSQE